MSGTPQHRGGKLSRRGHNKLSVISTLLPYEARTALVKASQVDHAHERARAVDDAIEHVRSLCPQRFKKG